MPDVLALLIVVYIAAAIIGLVVGSLMWLFWVAVVLFVITLFARLFGGGKGSGGPAPTPPTDGGDSVPKV